MLPSLSGSDEARQSAADTAAVPVSETIIGSNAADEGKHSNRRTNRNSSNRNLQPAKTTAADLKKSADVENDSSSANDARMKTARPYRSHKYPACTRCHKRRSRCTIEIPGQACLLCRMHGAPCSSASSKKDDKVAPRVGFIHRSLLPDAGAGYLDETSRIVGPVIARDTQVLDKYLGHMAPQSTMNNTSRTGSISQSSGKPIYHAPIPPRRPSPAAQCSCSRNLPLELLEQVDSFFEKLIGVYFEHLYPAFPILEEQCLVNKVMGDRMTIPRTFLVNFIAYILFYWEMGPELMLSARPNQDFAWQVAVQALLADMQKGDLTAIVSTVFNVAGRPSKSYIHNMTNVSRIVALSHSLGLNHDSQEWKIPDEQKRLRWKVWWAVLIHDRWFNFAQGTPPAINKAHYDVPLPTVELLAAGRINQPKHKRAAQCYIELCRLTEIVGDVLPLIYHTRSGNDNLAAEQTSRSEIELNRWYKSKPDWLDYNDFDHRPAVPGLANLQLSYLSVRMLLRRIAWHEVSQRSSEAEDPNWLESCLEAAANIVRFVASLEPIDLAGFWLPYNAHHFTSAVTLLLRCALQTSNYQVRQQSMFNARNLVSCLRRFRDEYNWDLADTALAQSEAVLKRIEQHLPKTPTPVQPSPMPSSTQGLDENFWSNPMLQYQGFGWTGAPEDMFPSIFSDLNAGENVFDAFEGGASYA